MKLKLARPLKEWKVTQKYGNKNDIYNDIGGYHNGMDLRAPHGTPIYAAHDGLASYQIDPSGGHGVVIITDKEYEDVNGRSSYFKTIYWHLPDSLKEPQYRSPFEDKTGFTKVKCGDLIGYADNTGRSTGSHLHFALKPVEKGEDYGIWYTINSKPPYYGAIDPEPYLPPLEFNFTWNFKKNMKYGDKSQDVLLLQRLLKELGYYDKALDGQYGKFTKVGVLAFQVAYKVCSPIESYYGYYCGPKTRKALNEI